MRTLTSILMTLFVTLFLNVALFAAVETAQVANVPPSTINAFNTIPVDTQHSPSEWIGILGSSYTGSDMGPRNAYAPRNVYNRMRSAGIFVSVSRGVWKKVKNVENKPAAPANPTTPTVSENTPDTSKITYLDRIPADVFYRVNE